MRSRVLLLRASAARTGDRRLRAVKAPEGFLEEGGMARAGWYSSSSESGCSTGRAAVLGAGVVEEDAVAVAEAAAAAAAREARVAPVVGREGMDALFCFLAGEGGIVVAVVVLLDCSCISKSNVCGLFITLSDATRLPRMWAVR